MQGGDPVGVTGRRAPRLAPAAVLIGLLPVTADPAWAADPSVTPAASAPGGSGGRGLGGGPANNVLLIIADDVGVDKLGAYSADVDPSYRSSAVHLPSTPTLDGLARQGARFTEVWSNPTCSPSRAALMTGTHAYRHGVGMAVGLAGGEQLDLSTTTTIARVMAAAGYATGLFGKWHLGDNGTPDGWAAADGWDDHLDEPTAFAVHPVSAGFQTFIGTLTGNLQRTKEGGGYTDWVALDAYGAADGAEPSVTAIARTEYATDATVADALAWIEEQSGPWLAVVSLHAAHVPLELPAEGCAYRSPIAPAPTSSIGTYEEMVECLDRRVGELVEGITDLDDTTVIFVGDNGTASGVAEGIYADGRGKGTIYESGVRVPLIVADGRTLARQRDAWSWSRDWMDSPVHVARPGEVIEDPVHLVDLFATVAALGGADPSTGVDAISVLPLLDGSTGLRRVVTFTEGFDASGVGQAAVRRGDTKLIVNIEPDGEGLPCRGGVELYDLSVDRFETTDLASAEPDTVDELMAVFDDIAGRVEGSWLAAPDCP